MGLLVHDLLELGAINSSDSGCGFEHQEGLVAVGAQLSALVVVEGPRGRLVELGGPVCHEPRYLVDVVYPGGLGAAFAAQEALLSIKGCCRQGLKGGGGGEQSSSGDAARATHQWSPMAAASATKRPSTAPALRCIRSGCVAFLSLGLTILSRGLTTGSSAPPPSVVAAAAPSAPSAAAARRARETSRRLPIFMASTGGPDLERGESLGGVIRVARK